MPIGEMKKFEEVVSPLSWIFIALGFLPPAVILFQPTLQEFIVLLIVDQLALFGVQKLDGWLFPKFFPDIVSYFPQLRVDTIAQFTDAQRQSLLHSMCRFPSRRALYCTKTTVLKVTPAILLVTFYWHSDGPRLLQFLLAVGLCSVCNSYFYGAALIENREFIFKFISQLHQRLNFTEVFRRFTFPPQEHEYTPALSLVAIWLFMLFCQATVVFRARAMSVGALVLQVSILGFCTMLLLARVWYLERRYSLGGLRTIFEKFETFEPDKALAALPLHPSPVLARFEMTFNSLGERIHAYEMELSQWLLLRAEQSRFHALGELAGLVVHDLSAPIHVMNFCVGQLEEEPHRIQDPRYLQQMKANVARAGELVTSVRTYLADSNSPQLGVSFSKIYEHTVRLLETQFLDRGIDKVAFEIDKHLSNLVLKVTLANGIHIFMNILSNSVSNLLSHRIENPKIHITLVGTENGMARILFSDNGTGLAQDHFERLTALVYVPTLEPGIRDGLGLRLVRRLIEKNGGSLKLLSKKEKGTHLCLELPIEEH